MCTILIKEEETHEIHSSFPVNVNEINRFIETHEATFRLSLESIFENTLLLFETYPMGEQNSLLFIRCLYHQLSNANHPQDYMGLISFITKQLKATTEGFFDIAY